MSERFAYPVDLTPDDGAWVAVFPDIPEFDDSRMRQVMFKLTRLVEDFLVAEEIRKEKAHRQKQDVPCQAKGEIFLILTFQIRAAICEPHDRMAPRLGCSNPR